MNRPKVILYVSASIDGRITMGTNATMFDAFKQPELYNMMGTMEDWASFTKAIKELYQPDMYLEGSHMVISETAELTQLPDYVGDPSELYQDFLPEDILRRPGRKTWTSLIDGRGRFRNGYNAECDDPETNMVYLSTQTAPPEYLAFLRSRNLPYMLEGKGRVDLPRMLEKVKTKLNVQTIATSSGGMLSGALIRSSLMDEINILFNPLVIGGFTIPTLFASPEPKWPSILPSRLRLLDLRTLNNDRLWLRYQVIHDR